MNDIINCQVNMIMHYGNTRNLNCQSVYFHNFLRCSAEFLCQLTCQSADIMSSLCGVGVRVNNFFSKTTRPRDMLFFLKDTLSIEDENCSRHANLSVRLFARDVTREVPPPKV